MEKWKVINSFQNYEVSNMGRVRNKSGLIMRQQETNGYPCVYLRDPKLGKKKYRMNVLVAEHFIPKVEGCTHVNHIDGNKQNNSINNLEWVTPKENTAHAKKNNLLGKPKGKTKTLEEKKKVVEEYYNTDITQIKLAEKHNVTLRTIERWVNNPKLK